MIACFEVNKGMELSRGDAILFCHESENGRGFQVI
jgi:hypothetical protein